MGELARYWTAIDLAEARKVFEAAQTQAADSACEILSSFLRMAHPEVPHQARQWLCSQISSAQRGDAGAYQPPPSAR